MPINPADYPPNWKDIARAVKNQAGWKCEQCGKQCYKPGERVHDFRSVLTVAHLNHTPMDCKESNLKALCAPCHLRLDANHHWVTKWSVRGAGEQLSMKEVENL